MTFRTWIKAMGDKELVEFAEKKQDAIATARRNGITSSLPKGTIYRWSRMADYAHELIEKRGLKV